MDVQVHTRRKQASGRAGGSSRSHNDKAQRRRAQALLFFILFFLFCFGLFFGEGEGVLAQWEGGFQGLLSALGSAVRYIGQVDMYSAVLYVLRGTCLAGSGLHRPIHSRPFLCWALGCNVHYRLPTALPLPLSYQTPPPKTHLIAPPKTGRRPKLVLLALSSLPLRRCQIEGQGGFRRAADNYKDGAATQGRFHSYVKS